MDPNLVSAHRWAGGSTSVIASADARISTTPAIVERFATGFDDLPEIIKGCRLAARDHLRRSGQCSRYFGLATSDATIDLIGTTVDL